MLRPPQQSARLLRHAACMLTPWRYNLELWYNNNVGKKPSVLSLKCARFALQHTDAHDAPPQPK